MQHWDLKKFEVFVTPLYDGNVNDALDDAISPPSFDQIKEIIDQLFNGLKQLKQANVCHNDIKPNNILYRLVGNNYQVKIGDFGQCGKKGGTPGWTAPIFGKERTPGKEDMYSMGLIILRLLCDKKDLFYALRDNWVELSQETKRNFNNIPEIKLVRKMTNLNNQPTIDVVASEWTQIKPFVQIITESRLIDLGVPASSLVLQFDHHR